MLTLFYRNKKDDEVISIDSDSEADDDSAVPSVTWDLSRALLQIEQMVEARCRKSPLGNHLVYMLCQAPE